MDAVWAASRVTGPFLGISSHGQECAGPPDLSRSESHGSGFLFAHSFPGRHQAHTCCPQAGLRERLSGAAKSSFPHQLRKGRIQSCGGNQTGGACDRAVGRRMDQFTGQMAMRSDLQNPEERRTGSRDSGSPGPPGHGLPWEDRDPAHTRAPHHGIKSSELQDSQPAASQPMGRPRNAAVSSEGTPFLLPQKLVEIKGLTPLLN